MPTCLAFCGRALSRSEGFFPAYRGEPTLRKSRCEAEVGPEDAILGSRYMPMTKTDHLSAATGPKRILTLDGGGIRGVLTLEYLQTIETMLRERSGRPEFRLCDYFDLIGGTSTGAIIAASLACGKTVNELRQLYRKLGQSVFDRSFFRRGVFATKFPSGPLRSALEEQLGKDSTLGSEVVRTGLLIVTKRLDTHSPWPIHNGPDGTYSAQDRALNLVQLVRASTAAPTYFEPEEMKILSRAGAAVEGAFVDGGVSPHNDPSLQALMVAVLHGHGFRWRTGVDQLLLVSIGTGTRRSASATREILGATPMEQGLRSLVSLMNDTGRTNQTLLQWLTNCLTPWRVDAAAGDMSLDSAAGPALATYVRYNVPLERTWLKNTLNLDFSDEKLEELAKMDEPGNIEELGRIGQIAAKLQIREEHFPQPFDVRL